MNNNTRPEQRPDINGKIVTRHVKNDNASKAPINVPAPSLSASATPSPVKTGKPRSKEYVPTVTEAPETVDDAYGDQLIAAGTSTDFAAMSKDETWDAVTAVSNRISKDNLWDVLEVFNKGIAETSHPDSFIVALEHTKSHVKIRDTWLDMHGADIADRRTYFQIEGENGYERYKTEYAKLAQKAAERDPRKAE